MYCHVFVARLDLYAASGAVYQGSLDSGSCDRMCEADSPFFCDACSKFVQVLNPEELKNCFIGIFVRVV